MLLYQNDISQNVLFNMAFGIKAKKKPIMAIASICVLMLVYVVFSDDKPLTEKYSATENMLKGRVISKHDLGHFFVKCLSTSEWDGKTVGVCGQYS